MFSIPGQGTDQERFGMFPPFREVFRGHLPRRLVPEPAIQTTRHSIIRGAATVYIQPHVLASNRPIAYKTFVAMKYIEILID